jgi:alpha-D-ribose 1-methylphosphonate 5-triphosphate synthase subunit PhnH
MNQHAVSAGFGDPVHEAQAAFRAVLEALSRPGQRMAIGRPVPGLGLAPAMAHLLLALTDDDTPVWWQQPGNAADWLRFHTGASVAAAPADAAFAVIGDVAAMPALKAFAPGAMESPEHATTLLIEVPSLSEGPAVEWHGPGIRDMQTVRLAGLPASFWTQWQANHAAFPQGVDIVFTCADAVLGLPRTTRVRRLEGV